MVRSLLLSATIGLVPPQSGKPAIPARLPSYEELAPSGRKCEEHSQEVIRKTVHRGVHAGREYWGCANEIPCGHFEWCETPSQQGRLAGDEAQQIETPGRAAASAANDLTSLNGRVARILYRSDGGFTVARVRLASSSGEGDSRHEDDEDGDEKASVGTGSSSTSGGMRDGRRRRKNNTATIGVKAVACLATARVGDEVSLRGRWVTHARYGRQFDASEAIPIEEKTTCVDGFELWLGSGVVPHVGPATAAKIVSGLGSRAEELLARFGAAVANGATDVEAEKVLEDAFQWKKQPRAILAPQVVARIASKVAQLATSRAIVVHLLSDEIGVPTIEAAFALERVHQEKAAAKFKEDPHGALMSAKGWGFRRADRVALATSFARPDSSTRLRYGVVHALAETAAVGGHCAKTPEELVDLASHDLGPLATRDYTPTREAVSEAIRSCVANDQLRRVGDLLFTPWLDRAEQTVAEALFERVGGRPRSGKFSTENDEVVDGRLSEEQREAVATASVEPLYAICGGPGTGKTFTARGVVEEWRRHNPEFKVALAAPTARGAAALGAAIGERATTIHRLLEFSPRLGDFARDRDNPLEVDAVVVDEVSMLDITLAARLFAAVPSHAKILLIGDPDQLPSVGPGALLRDVLECSSLDHRLLVPRATLTQIFRVSSSGDANEANRGPGLDAADIALDARAINQGTPPLHSRSFLQQQDDSNLLIPDGSVFLDIGKKDGSVATRAIVGAVDRLRTAGFDPLADVQVLAPMKRGGAGVDALNEALQDLLNPCSNKTTMRVKDRVIQTTNDYDTGVFNGDVGVVDQVMRNGSFVAVFRHSGKEARVMYSPKDLGDSVSLSYALTVHKAQGNEYPVVIMPVVAEHFAMLKRALLYTAVSRAKRLLVLVGSRDVLKQAVEREFDRPDVRTTGLQMRIQMRSAANTCVPEISSDDQRPVSTTTKSTLSASQQPLISFEKTQNMHYPSPS